MEQWILVNARKLRKGKRKGEHVEGVLTQEEIERYYAFLGPNLEHTYDWFRDTQPDISSYSIDQATQMSEAWHSAASGQGAGKLYEPTKPDLIMYGPQWKNPEWNGWTIQKVLSKNDLLVEGHSMNHCVGKYCEYVERGESIIYSIRDPSNNPKVTVETDEKNQIVQIQGNSNQEPAVIYKAMIKEWLTSKKNPGIIGYADTVDDPLDWNYNDEALEVINGYNILDEYGLERESYSQPEDLAQRALDIEMKSRNPYYGGSLTEIPEAIIDMVIRVNQQRKFKNERARKLDLANKISVFEDYLYKIEEKLLDEVQRYWDYDPGGHPQEEDFETPEEYEKAVEEFQEAEQEYFDDELQKTPVGGFVHDSFKYIQQLREKKVIPKYKPKEKAKPKVPTMAGSWYKKAQSDNGISSLMNKWEQQGVSLYLYEKGNKIILDNIIVPQNKRNQGIGSQIMKELSDYADSIGKRIELSPGQKDDRHGTTSRKRLVDFYKRFGLIENKGKNKDFTTTKTMYREPRTIKNEDAV